MTTFPGYKALNLMELDPDRLWIAEVCGTMYLGTGMDLETFITPDDQLTIFEGLD